jgi:hypothetical protein
MIRVLPEEGRVSAPTCRRHLVDNTNIQFLCAFSLKIKDIIAERY